jgi:hypothetical protein
MSPKTCFRDIIGRAATTFSHGLASPPTQLAKTAQLNNYVAKNVISRHNCPARVEDEDITETRRARRSEWGMSAGEGEMMVCLCLLGALES